MGMVVFKGQIGFYLDIWMECSKGGFVVDSIITNVNGISNVVFLLLKQNQNISLYFCVGTTVYQI